MGSVQKFKTSTSELNVFDLVMLNVDDSEPLQFAQRIDIFDLVVADVELNQFPAVFNPFDTLNGVELKSSMLNILELANTLKACDLLKCQFDILQAMRIFDLKTTI